MSGTHKITRLAFSAVLAGSPIAASANELMGDYIGTTDIFVNDFLGDGQDRWRSGGYSKSWLYRDGLLGYGELRGRAEIITPWTPAGQGPNNDRINVGLLGAGAFWEQRMGDTRFHYGGELALLGESTGLHAFQEGFHDLFGYENGYNFSERNDPIIDDQISGMISGEVSHSFVMGDYVRVRPFVEAQAGYETFVRGGGDVVIGLLSDVGRWTRDPITGFITPMESEFLLDWRGFSLVGGIDYTYMASSQFFPDSGPVEMEDVRMRARLGLLLDLHFYNVFLGVSELSEEFTTQSEKQRVGLLSVDLRF